MQVNRPAWPSETTEWALTVVGGPSAGTRLGWDRAEMVLGRETVGAALFRGDPAVSRRHAVLRILDGTCVVEDHNSKNGTFGNGVLIDRPTVLGPKDELRIGSTRLRLAPTLGDTALLAAIPVLEPEAVEWDGTASGGPTAPSPELSPEPRSCRGQRTRRRRRRHQPERLPGRCHRRCLGRRRRPPPRRCHHRPPRRRRRRPRSSARRTRRLRR